MPIATLIAAIIAALVAGIGVWLQRKSGRESAAAAERSAKAAERSADAATAAVRVNEQTSITVANRAAADALAKRYQDAAALLGHDRAAVRRAGVYAMARLADDWPEQRQVCVDVLCGYLKMPPVNEKSEPEVRAAITDVLAAHLRRDTTEVSWSDLRIDLSYAHLDQLDFSDTVFRRRVNFREAMFARTCLMDKAEFAEGADFDQARIGDGGLLRIEHCVLGGKTTFDEFVIEDEAHLVLMQAAGGRISGLRIDIRGRLFIVLNMEHSGESYDLTGAWIGAEGRLQIQPSSLASALTPGRRVALSGVHIDAVGADSRIDIAQILIDAQVVYWDPVNPAPEQCLTFVPDPLARQQRIDRLRSTVDP
ncbi:pentapeptide repeat-containing protein [Nocardia tenerifensis]|nr:pentapeptide repeat-containing protein [Nocardia tenerifensis]